MLKERSFRIAVVGGDTGLGLDNETHAAAVQYDGSEMKVKL